MTLAPIRGAPPGASIPDFPTEPSVAGPAQPAAAPIAGGQPRIFKLRQPHTPIEIGGGGITLTFRVSPEMPAITRASMTVHVAADPVGAAPQRMPGSLRMSAANARAFLTDLRNGGSPIVATGDEDAGVQIECAITEAGWVFLVRAPGQRDALHRCIIDRSYDLKTMANELLADLGA